MTLPLVLSSFAAGVIATALMVFALYLPRLWRGNTYDMVGSIGSALVGRESQRSKFMGWTVYFLVGVAFAVAYGWLVLTLLELDPPWRPQLVVWTPLPAQFDLFFVLLGAGVGAVHGSAVAWWLTRVLPHHPVPAFREHRGLFPMQLLSHVVYGATVMLFQHQLLQLLLPT